MLPIWSDYSAKVLPLHRQILEDCAQVAERLDTPLLIVGAFARDVIFDKYQQDPGRTTWDLDFALSVGLPEQFESFKKALIETGNYRPSKIQHRLECLIEEKVIPVDLVPFGKIEQPPGVLT